MTLTTITINATTGHAYGARPYVLPPADARWPVVIGKPAPPRRAASPVAQRKTPDACEASGAEFYKGICTMTIIPTASEAQQNSDVVINYRQRDAWARRVARHPLVKLMHRHVLGSLARSAHTEDGNLVIDPTYEKLAKAADVSAIFNTAIRAQMDRQQEKDRALQPASAP